MLRKPDFERIVAAGPGSRMEVHEPGVMPWRIPSEAARLLREARLPLPRPRSMLDIATVDRAIRGWTLDKRVHAKSVWAAAGLLP